MAGQRRSPEGADGGGAAVPIFLPHPGEVTLVVAPGDETGQNVLLQRRDRTGIEAQLLPVAFQQPGRQYQKAKTHRGGNGLGKGVQVNDPAPVIDALQGGDGTTSVAELAVIVILDDGGTGILRSAEGLAAGRWGSPVRWGTGGWGRCAAPAPWISSAPPVLRPDYPAGWGRRRLRRRHRPDGSWDSRGPPRRTPCPGPAVGPAISKGIPHRRR